MTKENLTVYWGSSYYTSRTQAEGPDGPPSRLYLADEVDELLAKLRSAEPGALDDEDAFRIGVRATEAVEQERPDHIAIGHALIRLLEAQHYSVVEKGTIAPPSSYAALLREAKEFVSERACEGDTYNTGAERAAKLLDRIEAALVEPSTERHVTTVGGLETFISRMGQGSLDTHPSLLRCPMCGSAAAFHDSGRTEKFSRWVECSNTSCGIRTPEHYQDRETAAVAWNRRDPEKSPAKPSEPRRQTRYCDYDLCPDTFDPAHSNNDH